MGPNPEVVSSTHRSQYRSPRTNLPSPLPRDLPRIWWGQAQGPWGSSRPFCVSGLMWGCSGRSCPDILGVRPFLPGGASSIFRRRQPVTPTHPQTLLYGHGHKDLHVSRGLRTTCPRLPGVITVSCLSFPQIPVLSSLVGPDRHESL